MTKDPDQLLEIVLAPKNDIGSSTNFTAALQTIQREMEGTWVTERYARTVVIPMVLANSLKNPCRCVSV
jgi:hypothetical protein